MRIAVKTTCCRAIPCNVLRLMVMQLPDEKPKEQNQGKTKTSQILPRRRPSLRESTAYCIEDNMTRHMQA